MKFLAVLVTTLLSTSVFGTTLKVDLKSPDTINLNGIVSYGLVKEPIEQIVSRAGKTKLITMIINSPGGEVYAGQQLISAMLMAQSRGTKFRCAVSTIAASMAFQILAFCDERLALPHSLLLWHPPRVVGMVSLRPSDARQLSEELLRMERTLTNDLQDRLPIPTKLFWEHYHAETLWLGKELAPILKCSLRLIDDIDGIDTMEIKRDFSPFDEAGVLYICPQEKCAKVF